MILTKKEIKNEIRNKIIIITNVKEINFGPASVDLTLGSEIRVFKKSSTPILINDYSDYKKFSWKRKITKKQSYVLNPGEMILGITEQKISLPENISGWISSRSKFARFGLMVHVNAAFVHPGVSNRQVLEIYNAGPNALRLVPGERICQIVFERCEGSARYLGKFRNQEL